VVTDLVQIRVLGTAGEAENQDFRRYLAAHHHRIEEFQSVATRTGQQIDCTACANCCRYSVVSIGDSEIAEISNWLGMSAGQVKALYTEPDPEDPGHRILTSRDDGCVFLDRNLCLIYDVRPKVCRDFPHTAIGAHSLGGRLSSVCRWAALCPIIYNALEEYKRLVGYQRCRRRGSRAQEHVNDAR
jgi:Fe-S-cluster containining protein